LDWHASPSTSEKSVSKEAIRRHAANTGMSADEITKVADTVVVRDDPVADAATV
jgi:hypothetical protein